MAKRVEHAHHGRRNRHERQERHHDPREPDGEIELAGYRREALGVQRHQRTCEEQTEHDEPAGNEEQRVQDVVPKPPCIVFPPQREVPREGRNECRAHCAFGEQIADQIRHAEGDEERVHFVAGAEHRGKHLFANESEDSAGEGGGSGKTCGAGDAVGPA